MRVLLLHDKDLAAGAPAGAGVCAPDGGGLAVHLARTIAALCTRAQHVAVVGFEEAPDAPRPLGSESSPAAHRLRAFRHRYRPEVARQLERIVDAEAPDVIHLHGLTTIHPWLVRRLANWRPLVWSFHDVSPVCFRRTLLDARGQLCTQPLGFGCVTGGCYKLGSLEGPLSDAVRVGAHPLYLRAFRTAPRRALVPSRYLADVLVRNGFERERVEVLPLFSRFGAPESTERASDAGAERASPRPAPRLLFVGRLTADKGALQWIATLARLRDAAWSATVVGDGELRDELARRLAAEGLAERVRFAGALGAERLEQEYRASDIVVLPSLAPESFGLVGVEAMSFAKPVVAFDAGGVSEWLRDGETGRLARHGDTEHLAACLRSLLDDADLCTRLGDAGRRRLLDAGFTEARHVERLLAIYDEAVQSDAPAPGRPSSASQRSAGQPR